MTKVGLYLSGAGTLDGSDIFTAVMAYMELQKMGLAPVPISRDVQQGVVTNHFTAQSENHGRNALHESARIVRGNIRDMRDVDVDMLAGAAFVGGEGTLATWTDFHERQCECRVTERLKFHVLELYKNSNPLLGFGNSVFAIARILREYVTDIEIGKLANGSLNDCLTQWGYELSSSKSYWNENEKIGWSIGPTREEDMDDLGSSVRKILSAPDWSQG